MPKDKCEICGNPKHYGRCIRFTQHPPLRGKPFQILVQKSGFPKPDWESEWMEFPQAGWKQNIQHNLGTINVIVYMITKTPHMGISNYAVTGQCIWNKLTSTKIDIYCGYRNGIEIKILIWKIPT